MKTKFNKLQEIDKTNPFKVPDNYFAHFNEEIMDRLPEKEPVEPEPVSLWDRVKPWVYMAAAFIWLYVSIDFLTKNTRDSNGDASHLADNQEIQISTPQTENYWSTVQISEEEFYQILEEQLVDDSYFDYMYNQYYLN